MLKNYKIVILDDEDFVTSSLKILFEMEGANDVQAFNSPKLALEYLKSNSTDVVISDFMMPEMNGVEFLSEIKALYPDLSLILLTAYADKENAIKAINDVGIYKYIEKPWNNDDFLLTIKNACERSKLRQALSDKIHELEVANSKLEEYSSSLEKLVEQKTANIVEINSKLSAIIENCADGILLIDNNGNILNSNPSAENMFGMVEAILKTKNINDIFNSTSDSLEIKLNSDQVQFLRDLYIINVVNDKNIPVEISCSPISNDEIDLKWNNFVLVIRDISVAKDMERLRDDFIATLTHDLRTPALAAIQTLEYFLDGSLGQLSDKQKMLLSTMKCSNQDMLGLINTLLEVYKYESGKILTVKTTFSFTKLVKDCVSQVIPLADNKNISIKYDFNINDEVLVEADRNEIRRVIINFLGNAVNYSSEGGMIELKLSLNGKDIQFSVKDNGIGISKQSIPLLFKRFSQGTNEHRSMSTGLGLYLSKQIIDAHNGKIWLESDKGKGSEFFFILADSVKNEGAKVL